MDVLCGMLSVYLIALLQDTPDDTALHQSLKQDLDNALLTLNTRECGVLRLRYGLDDGEEKTLEEIGQRFQVCPIDSILVALSDILPTFRGSIAVSDWSSPSAGHTGAHSAD